MKPLLVVVDMQKDFVTGPLGTKEAEAIVNPLADYIRNFPGDVVYTLDSHRTDYLKTQEGEKLPIPHCILGSTGWEMVPEIYHARLIQSGSMFQKDTFGSDEFYEWLKHQMEYDSVYFAGVCTGICVISNAVLAKTVKPELPINILASLCACVTPESHEQTLKALELLQCNIIP